MCPGGYELESFRLLTERGHAPERLGPDEIRRRLPAWNADRYVDGYSNRRAGYVESGLVVERLAIEAERRGIRLLAGTSAAGIAVESGRTVGMQAVEAVAESGGGAPTATDAEILAALRDLGGEGLRVESVSALPVACARAMAAAGAIAPDETIVCLLTAAGVKRPEPLAAGEARLIAPAIAALEAVLADALPR